jgi:hypothetical protein
MQNMLLKKLMVICMLSLLPSKMSAMQSQGLGCDFANIMAGVTVAGVASRTLYSAVCYAFAPDNIAHSLGRPRELRRGNPILYVLDIVKKGFYPALGVGAFTAVAACSGSWRQLEVKDAIKPAACAFGALFLAKIPFIYYGNKYGFQNFKVEFPGIRFDGEYGFKGSSFNSDKRDYWLEFDRSYLDRYATAAITVGVPLYVLYQRYKQH